MTHVIDQDEQHIGPRGLGEPEGRLCRLCRRTGSDSAEQDAPPEQEAAHETVLKCHYQGGGPVDSAVDSVFKVILRLCTAHGPARLPVHGCVLCCVCEREFT